MAEKSKPATAAGETASQTVGSSADGVAAAAPGGPAPPDQALPKIGDALRGLRYGSVLAIVQDGKVVQIERTEKTRFGK